MFMPEINKHSFLLVGYFWNNEWILQRFALWHHSQFWWKASVRVHSHTSGQPARQFCQRLAEVFRSLQFWNVSMQTGRACWYQRHHMTTKVWWRNLSCDFPSDPFIKRMISLQIQQSVGHCWSQKNCKRKAVFFVRRSWCIRTDSVCFSEIYFLPRFHYVSTNHVFLFRGLVVSKDMTHHLQATTYWPSYNTP